MDNTAPAAPARPEPAAPSPHLPFALGLLDAGCVHLVKRRYATPLCWVGTTEPLPGHLVTVIEHAIERGLAVVEGSAVRLTDRGVTRLPQPVRQRGLVLPR